MTDTIDTSGFYKLENNDLLHAPNFVCAPGFELWREQRETYSYPVDGWSWFDSEEEARTFFGL
jgi:hypothetical protein